MNCLALGLMTAVLLGREAIAQPIERVNLDTDCGPVRVAIENLNGTETYQASFHRTFPDIPPGVDEYIVSRFGQILPIPKWTLGSDTAQGYPNCRRWLCANHELSSPSL
jgi:hypothetical protein